LQLFASLLAEMAQGHAVTLLPLYAELTTQEAADLLHVSRPHVVRLMQQGYLPFHKIGTHRRVRLHDVLAYQQRQRAEREHALDALVAQAQELDMGY
jgi:excisionase family DNA binding protein